MSTLLIRSDRKIYHPAVTYQSFPPRNVIPLSQSI